MAAVIMLEVAQFRPEATRLLADALRANPVAVQNAVLAAVALHYASNPSIVAKGR